MTHSFIAVFHIILWIFPVSNPVDEPDFHCIPMRRTPAQETPAQVCPMKTGSTAEHRRLSIRPLSHAQRCGLFGPQARFNFLSDCLAEATRTWCLGIKTKASLKGPRKATSLGDSLSNSNVGGFRCHSVMRSGFQKG